MIDYRRKWLWVRVGYHISGVTVWSAWHRSKVKALEDLVDLLAERVVIDGVCKHNNRFNCPSIGMSCKYCGVYLYNREA